MLTTFAAAVALPLGWLIPSEPELLILGVIALLLFGNRLPSVMRSLGSGVSEFKKGLDDVNREIHREVTSDAPRPSPEGPAAAGDHGA